MADTKTVGEPNRILIRNIGHPATKDIEALFARFGPITNTKMPVDRLTGRHMGSAFMTLTTAENAATAISTLNGTSFKGRTLHLTHARAEWPRPKPMAEPGRIFVRNIGNSTKKDIEALFARFGALTESKMPVDRPTKRQTGIAFVTFTTAKHAATSTSTLNGTRFQGRML